MNVERGLVFDTALLAVQYALSGEGVALIDNYLFGDYIRSGRLIRPFDEMLDDGFGYYLVTHPEGLERYGDRAVPLLADRALWHFHGRARAQLALGVSMSDSHRHEPPMKKLTHESW